MTNAHQPPTWGTTIMTDPDTIREIQHLLDENRDAMHNPHLTEHRIAALLGIEAVALRKTARGENDEGGRMKDEG